MLIVFIVNTIYRREIKFLFQLKLTHETWYFTKREVNCWRDKYTMHRRGKCLYTCIPFLLLLLLLLLYSLIQSQSSTTNYSSLQLGIEKKNTQKLKHIAFGMVIHVYVNICFGEYERIWSDGFYNNLRPYLPIQTRKYGAYAAARLERRKECCNISEYW